MPAPIPLAPPVTMARTPASGSVMSDPSATQVFPARRCGAAPLEDRAGDLQLDDLVHVEAELTEQFIGVLAVPGGTGRRAGLAVELERCGHQLERGAVGVLEILDVPVRHDLRVGEDVDRALH